MLSGRCGALGSRLSGDPCSWALVGMAHRQFGMAIDASIQFETSSRQLVTQALIYNAEKLHWELRFIGDEDVLTFQNGRLFDEKKRDRCS
jgi:hypothetical protein